MLGEIRLQWWRDALEQLATGEATGNPVADALGAAVRENALPAPALLGMIDARAFDVSGEVMPDLPALKAYLNKTAGALFALGAHVLQSSALRPEDAAREAGLAFGLTGLMRDLSVHRARGRLFLPATAFTDAGIEPGEVLAGVSDRRLDAALAMLRGEARDALARARTALGDTGKEVRAAFLPLALVEPYLDALARPAHDPLREAADINPLRRLWRLTRAAMRGRL